MKNAYKVILIGGGVVGGVYAGTKPGAMTREEKNKEIVGWAVAALNRRDWESLRDLYSPKFVQHSPASQEPTGWEDYELGLRIAHRKLPDFRYRIEHSLAEVDKVVVRMIGSTPVKSRWPSMQSKERVFEITEIDIIRIANGWIVEEWAEFDTAQALKLARVMKFMEQAR